MKRLSTSALGSARSPALRLVEWRTFSLRHRRGFVRTQSPKSGEKKKNIGTAQSEGPPFAADGKKQPWAWGERCLPVQQLAVNIPSLRRVQCGVHVSGFQGGGAFVSSPDVLLFL